MILAELHYYRNARTADMNSLEKLRSWARMDDILGISPKSSKIRQFILYAMLIFGMYLGSFLYTAACETPGYMWMCKVD
jgi:hypothetical protein